MEAAIAVERQAVGLVDLEEVTVGVSEAMEAGTYMDPKSGKGFIIAIAAITFITVLIIFILVMSRQNTAQSPSFYLASIIICAILAALMLIATIVYLVAVNPTSQTSGSMMYNQILQLCAQYKDQDQASGIFINQYLYHYCVVEPEEVSMFSWAETIFIIIFVQFRLVIFRHNF